MTVPISDLQLFIGGTAALLWWSNKPLRKPGSHGFYRFFVWEAILMLIVMNREPQGDQFIADRLLQLSLLPLILGFFALRWRGRSNASRDDSALFGWEKTTALVTVGVYRLIRHPMYSALLCLNWGLFFRAISLPGLAIAAVATYFLMCTARAEEQECIDYFGDAYRDYMQRTRRFIPWLF